MVAAVLQLIATLFNQLNVLYIICVFCYSSKNEADENDMSQEEELAVLKEQHALLTRLLHQQKEVS